MKKFFSLALALMLVIALGASVPARAVMLSGNNFYCVDDANVLSMSTEDLIRSTNARLEEQCAGAQIVVVSVDYMDGYHADEYAYTLMNEWGVGSADFNNGMLLVFATRENKGWLAVGEGLSRVFDDSTAEKYLEKYFWDSYDAQAYDKGVNSLFSALVTWYDDYYDTQYSAPNGEYYSSSSAQSEGIDLTAVFVVILILWLFSRSRGGRRRGGFWGPFFLGSMMNNRRYGSGSSWTSHSSGGFSSHSSGGFGGHSSGGFGGGMGHGGGGHSGGGAGRR